MRRASAIQVLDDLHAAQNDFYSGGDENALRGLLVADITWTVPGASPIAGAYRGLEQVFAYFRRRRDLASGTFQMRWRDVLVGESSRVAALTDGTAIVNGTERCWSTVGLYDIAGNALIASCWLLPLDQRTFDEIWSG